MPEVTVTSGGRLFKAFGHISFKEREWPLLSKLIALSAYNGAKLWERELTPGYMIHRNTIIATPETLFLADNDSCKLIDAATGKVKDEIVISSEIAEGGGWKWMALENGVLYALIGKKDVVDPVLYGTRKKAGWPWSGLGKTYAKLGKEYPWGFGRTLLAINPQTKEIIWKRTEPEDIDSRSMSMKNGRIFIYSSQKYLASIYGDSGETLWKSTDAKLLESIGEHDNAQSPRKGYASQVYTKASDDVLYFAGPQRKMMVAVSAETGKQMWTYEDGNMQLIVRENGVYAMGRMSDSKLLDPKTGKILADLDCLRGNCTRATGTVDSIFARGDAHGGTLRLAIDDNKSHRIPAMRPACQDGVVVANGLLYWGPWMCDCNHSLVGLITLGPAGDFDFAQSAKQDRLEVLAENLTEVLSLSETPADWPTYRKDNTRSAQLAVSVPNTVKLQWTKKSNIPVKRTAPIAVGDLTFFSGTDGIIYAVETESGKERWKAYTGGRVHYPPSYWKGRVFAGSADGWVYAFEAATGKPLWKFRAAPIERKIPVYGELSSTWPVMSGTIVEDGTVYAAAGIVSHDGTHVYALDAITGKLKWQNNTSGQLMQDDIVCGVSVQGHMLIDDGKLYLAGGNVVSPGVFDLETGKCLNTLENEWQKAPRGSELFLIDGQVRVFDKTLYSPREYIPSRYHAKYLLQAGTGGTVIQGTENAMMRVQLAKSEDEKPKLIWQQNRFIETSAVVVAQNAILAVGSLKNEDAEAKPTPVFEAYNLETGKLLFSHKLPTYAASWGLAVDRTGRSIVTLENGEVLCFGK